MLITKACTRCRGDLAHVSDIGDSYYSCVQCGHTLDHLPAAPARLRPAAVRPAAAPREPVTHEEVHRRRIRRRLAERRDNSAA